VTKAPVLIAGTIRQNPEILKEYLTSLTELDLTGFDIQYYFIDDNVDTDASAMLHNFKPQQTMVVRIPPQGEYSCSEETHHWTQRQMERVGRAKDRILHYAKQTKRHVFLVDSDLALHPWTLQQLWVSGREIISEIFWTQWRPGDPFLPQVWVKGQYTLYEYEPGERLEATEMTYRVNNFLSILKNPGIYEVGGLGACTLIRLSAISKGVSFERIKNLELIGEDRYFCVRASVLGIKLLVDTHLPAFHIYRASELNQLPCYREKCRQSIQWSQENKIVLRDVEPQPSLQEMRVVKQKRRLTLVMTVHNEAGRYLSKVLEQAAQFITDALIIDDASSDATPELCRELLSQAGVPLRLVQNQESGFTNEIDLRKRAWDLAAATDPDWMLFLDADEVWEDKAVTELLPLLDDGRWDFYAFRLYDFWDRSGYREDQYWQAHKFYRPFLIRYQPNFVYQWKEQPLHCGRIPSNITALPGTVSYLRVKHFGWALPEDRQRKYDFYLKQDPEGVYGVLNQYLSILDPEPNLVEFVE
jgi:hypothetical protein